MAEHRETEVRRDADGNIIGSTEHVDKRPPRRGGGGFGIGAFAGLAIAAVAVIVFAISQGSFQNAGVEADQAAKVAKVELGQAAESTGDALETAGDAAERATDQPGAD